MYPVPNGKWFKSYLSLLRLLSVFVLRGLKGYNLPILWFQFTCIYSGNGKVIKN
jgi:hypothetical protein